MTNQLGFQGKGIFVCSSAAGLGRGIAETLHGLGASVAINDPDPAAVDRTIREMGAGPRLAAAAGDLSRIAEVGSIVGKGLSGLGRLDALVCITGRASIRGIDEITAAYWEEVLGRGAKAAFFTAQACLPALRASRGSIVNVVSVVGLVGGPKAASAWATTNGAMIQMTRMMALELAADGVRVNTVCAGWAEGEDAHSQAVFADYIAHRSPLARAVTPEECAAVVALLASPQSSYLTGGTFVADGGISSGHYVSQCAG